MQVALDFLELERAVKLAHEAVEGGVDWLEAGTPLIKSEGLEAVRVLRREFPGRKIVADLKTMDAGRLEVEAAAKAGANVVVVMAAACFSTIVEAVRAAENFGAEIAVDLLGVSDPVGLARRLEECGVAQLYVHTPVDDQMLGKDPFEVVRRLTAKVRRPVAVAGGINSENAAEALKAGASIVIVGGAITKSPDAVEAARTIRRALDTSTAIASNWYKRVDDSSVAEALRKVSTANVSDALHRGEAIEGVRPLRTGLKMVGTAFTVRTYPGDWAKPVAAIDEAASGQVIVVDAGGLPPAVWGELATHSAVQKKLGGLVVWGAVRDAAEIRELGFPVFSKLICPNAGEPKGFGETNVALRVGGITVRPGDWIVGDDDGVVVVPRERAVETANRAMDVLERENRIRKEIADGSSSLGKVTELLKWEKV